MPYWSKRLGRTKLIGRQIYSRGGTMYCELIDNRVEIAGSLVEILSGELTIQF